MGLNPLNNRPITREELIELIKNNEDVRFVNTSEIRDFSNLLEGFDTFNQDISRWDVSNGVDFSFLFWCTSYFNQDINKWNVSNGKNFEGMFSCTGAFNKPLNNWDVSSGENFGAMFFYAESFNQPLDKWNVSNGKKFYTMFYGNSFNQDISKWDISNGIDFQAMFGLNSVFNHSLNEWNIINKLKSLNTKEFSNFFWDTESFDFKNVSTWFESFKSLNEMKDLLDKLSLNYIYEKDKYITFYFGNEIKLKSAIKDGIIPLDKCKNNDSLESIIVDKNKYIYQLFEMKYSDVNDLLDDDIFYFHNNKIYNKKLVIIKDDMFIEDLTFSDFLLNQSSYN